MCRVYIDASTKPMTFDFNLHTMFVLYGPSGPPAVPCMNVYSFIEYFSFFCKCLDIILLTFEFFFLDAAFLLPFKAIALGWI